MYKQIPVQIHPAGKLFARVEADGPEIAGGPFDQKTPVFSVTQIRQMFFLNIRNQKIH
jgi:hypothetical protein